MSVLRLDKRLVTLEAKRNVAFMRLDHLSDAQLEAMAESLRSQMHDALDEHGVKRPPEWYQLTQAQQDLWLSARIEELRE